MKFLVTGCAGFIGFHVTRRLLDAGHSVVGIDNLNDYYDPALKRSRLALLGVDPEQVRADNLSVQSAEGSFVFACIGVERKELLDIYTRDENFDAVCHLAAQAGVRYSIDNPQTYVDSNLQGFFNILEYCRHSQCRLVFASSSSVYGNSADVPYRETQRTDFPVSFYGATKKAGEVMASSYASLYGIDTTGLRFFTVYGPWGRPDMAPYIFTDNILRGQTISVFNNGIMSRDFTYIDDIMSGVYLTLTTAPATSDALLSENFRLYNIGNSQPVQLMDFISTVERLTGREAVKEFLPMQPGDVLATWADTTLLERDYGYRPRTSLEEGLGNFIEWYRSYYDI